MNAVLTERGQRREADTDCCCLPGIAVLAFCLVTNQCQVDSSSHTSSAPCHQEVLDAAASKEKDLRNFVASLVEILGPHLSNMI